MTNPHHGSRGRLPDRQLLLALAAAFLLLSSVAWAMLVAAPGDLGLLGAFNTDERLHVEIVQRGLENGSLDLGFANYGHLHFNLVLVPLLVLSPIIDPSVEMIILLLRFQCLVFGALTAGAVFQLTRSICGSLAGWVAWSLVLSSRSFLELSWVSHPDVPAVFFLAASLLALQNMAASFTVRKLLLASSLAGLAFAAKYTGLFLMPWIVVVAWVGSREDSALQRMFERVSSARHALVLALVASSFAVAFWFDPQRLAEWLTSDGELPRSAVQVVQALRGGAVLGGVAIALAAAWTWKRDLPIVPPWLARLAMTACIGTAAFFAAFALSSPGSLLRLSFVRGLLVEGRHVGGSQQVLLGQWLQTLAGPWVLGAGGTALLLMAILVTMRSRGRVQLSDSLSRPETVHALWAVSYFAFVTLGVGLVAARYLLPILPSLAFLAGLGARALASWKTKRAGRAVAAVVWVGLLLLQFGGTPDWLAEAREQASTRETSGRVQAGNWLAQNFAADLRVYYDEYTYLPPRFVDSRRTWGGTVGDLTLFDPDLVLVSEKIAERYATLDETSPQQRDSHQYYRILGGPESSYELLRDFGEVKVYGRKQRVTP